MRKKKRRGKLGGADNDRTTLADAGEGSNCVKIGEVEMEGGGERGRERLV